MSNALYPPPRNTLNQGLCRLVIVLISINGFYYIASSLVLLFNAPMLRLALHYMERINILENQFVSVYAALLFGSMLLLVAWGLIKRIRIALIWTVVLLVLILLLHIGDDNFRLSFFITLATLLLTLYCQQAFNKPLAFFPSGQIIGLISTLIFPLAYGIIGAYLLRDEFTAIHNWTDAAYYTLVTYSTVGFGDIVPETELGKWFSASMIMIGISSFATAAAIYFGPFLDRRLKEVFKVLNKFDQASHHYIICGGNMVAIQLANQFARARKHCVVITPEPVGEVINNESKYIDHINGTATDINLLKRCSINRAAAVLAVTDSDADNILIALHAGTAAGENKNLQIVINVNNEDNIPGAQKAGAHDILTPSRIYSETVMQKLALQTG